MNSNLKQAYKAFLVLTFLAVAGCTNGQAEKKANPYDRLCSIYEEELAGKDSAGPTTFQRLASRLDEEVPELEEQLGHLANFPKEEFYAALKEMAEGHTGEAWNCSFIKQHYES